MGASLGAGIKVSAGMKAWAVISALNSVWAWLAMGNARAKQIDNHFE
jgi:hypothetical protein